MEISVGLFLRSHVELQLRTAVQSSPFRRLMKTRTVDCALFIVASVRKGGWIRFQECGTRCHEVCVGAMSKKQFICGKCFS